jgi:hypothetical protein
VTRRAVGIFLQVVLVVLLCFPERSRLGYLGHYLSGPQTGCVDVSDGVESGLPLFFTGGEDGRTDAAPNLVALPVHCHWIVDLEEELQEIPERKGVGVKDNVYRLSVIAQVDFGRMRGISTGVSHPGRDDPGLTTQQLLGAPVAPAGKDCRSCRIGTSFVAARVGSTKTISGPCRRFRMLCRNDDKKGQAPTE